MSSISKYAHLLRCGSHSMDYIHEEVMVDEVHAIEHDFLHRITYSEKRHPKSNDVNN